MLTKIDLCSMALLKLGEPPIQSFQDDTVAAKLGRTLTDFVLDSLLALHPWHFACRTIELVKNQNGDIEIPLDVLRIIKTDGEVQGNKIICGSNKTTILAIVRVSPEMFPSYFSSLVATRLAMEFCIPITSDQTVFRMLASLYETELQSAKFLDSTMSKNCGIESFSLISSRF